MELVQEKKNDIKQLPCSSRVPWYNIYLTEIEEHGICLVCLSQSFYFNEMSSLVP